MKIKTIGAIIFFFVLIGISTYVGLKHIGTEVNINNNTLLIILTGFYATATFLILVTTWYEKLVSKHREIIERILIPIKKDLIDSIYQLSNYWKLLGFPTFYIWYEKKDKIPHLAYNLPPKLYNYFDNFLTHCTEYSDKKNTLFKRISEIVIQASIEKIPEMIEKVKPKEIEKIKLKCEYSIPKTRESGTLTNNLIIDLFFEKTNLEEYLKREMKENNVDKKGGWIVTIILRYWGFRRGDFQTGFTDFERVNQLYNCIKVKIEKDDEIEKIMNGLEELREEASKLKDMVEEKIMKWS